MASSGEKFRSKIGNSYLKKDVEDWQPRLKAELAALKRSGGNRQCCDCGVLDVTWASPKLGTFLCVTCSDVHRAAGAHITCVKNFSTYLWSPDEVQMMRAVGNDRAKELYRHGQDLSWQPQDTKERKVRRCTELYGSDQAQRLVKDHIAAASASANGAGEASAPAPAKAAPAPAAAKPQDAPSWLDSWPEEKAAPLQSKEFGDWFENMEVKSVPPSQVQPKKVGSQSLPRGSENGGYQKDLVDVFGPQMTPMAAGPAPVAAGPAPVQATQAAAVCSNPFPVVNPATAKCGRDTNPFRQCGSYVQDREKDFWDSVNWDELLK
mmetsp:Transcript_33954/g.81465  ORF Transcript_33954/g.81465 Transcript_33954/m.81465 type:complete len:321 (+) Transcript_33954:79-1041(+)